LERDSWQKIWQTITESVEEIRILKQRRFFFFFGKLFFGADTFERGARDLPNYQDFPRLGKRWDGATGSSSYAPLPGDAKI